MEKKEKERGGRARESQITEKTKERKKKKVDQCTSIAPPERTENWLVKIFFGILYYRSEKKLCPPTENFPKVKLPRSRHK